MMVYEGSKSTRDNFGKFIHKFQPETKTLIRKLERILIKLYRQNVTLLFNIYSDINYFVSQELTYYSFAYAAPQDDVPWWAA